MPPPRPSKRGESLVVVSNRLPYNLPEPGTDRRPRRNVGGLVNALEPVLAQRDGRWIGWDGVSLPSAAALSSALSTPRRYRTETGIELCGVPLTHDEIRRYYHGLSNRTLWPLFHSIPDKAIFDSEDFETYARVNRRFAETVMSCVEPDDRVWVHDYHLMLVPALLREAGFRGRLDFFLHIPFPAPEIFLTLPWRRRLLDGLRAADRVVFHVETYRRNFLRAARVLTGCEIDAPGRADTPDAVPAGTAHASQPRPDAARAAGDAWIVTPRRRTAVGVSPLGVDVDEFGRIADLPATRARASRIRAVFGDRAILFGADRLDYTKGVRQRLLAVERFLTRNPAAAGTFVMLQVVVPSRHQVEEYRALKREIDREVGRINGEHGTEGWVPIHYSYGALDRHELVAHYRAADVALVTPLRDGLNLVAPEFVASRTDGDGVLVLSEFAGVAEQLQDAIHVNPHDLEGCSHAIHEALRMEPVERRFRMVRLHAQVRANTVADWAARCLALPARRARAADAALRSTAGTLVARESRG